LSVSYGQIFALLGPNGGGKTTTIRMLMGILAPTSGSARIDGLDCFEDRVEVKRPSGYLPDEPIFQDHLRGREIIRFSGEMHGIDLDEIGRMKYENVIVDPSDGTPGIHLNSDPFVDIRPRNSNFDALIPNGRFV
jgi:ABC-type multidrug transport system ATPase subunit